MALTAAAAPAARVAQDPDPAALQRAFAALPTARQLAVLGEIETRLRQSDVPALVRIAAAAATARDPAPLRPRTFHDPARYAPVAPARVVVPESSPEHAAVRRDFPPVVVLRDLHPTVIYDWLAGAPARNPVPVTATQRFADLCEGYPPDADAAIAAVLVELDRDGDQREFAEWCEQLYADRGGKVFAGITLYEAWYSGRTVEVPDVDAIAFARDILRTQAFQSPIPDGARRDRLYDKIRGAFRRHREYRTLCEAAAAAFVTVSPALDPVYLPLIDRMHLMWGESGHDIGRLAERLTAQDRGELLDALDDRIRTDHEAFATAEASKQEMAALAASVRAVCAATLAGGDR